MHTGFVHFVPCGEKILLLKKDVHNFNYVITSDAGNLDTFERGKNVSGAHTKDVTFMRMYSKCGGRRKLFLLNELT